MKLIDALRLIGINSVWVGAFASHPAEYRTMVMSYKRVVAKAIHPDVASHIPLSGEAGKINLAFTTIDQASDKSLAAAMSEFADVYALPSLDTISALRTLKRRNDELEKKCTELEALIAQEEGASKQVAPPPIDLRLLYELLLSPYRSHEDDRVVGEILSLASLRGQYFYTPIDLVSDKDRRGRVHKYATTYLYYINKDGRVYQSGVTKEVTSTKDKRAIRTILLGEIDKRFGVLRSRSTIPFETSPGKAIGFVDSDYLDLMISDESTVALRSVFPSYDGKSDGVCKGVASATTFLEACVQLMETETRFVATSKIDTLVTVLPPPAIGLVVLDDVKTDMRSLGGVGQEVHYTVIYIADFLPSKD